MDHVLSEEDLRDYEASIPTIPWLGYDHQPSKVIGSFDEYALQRGWSKERLLDLKEGRLGDLQQESVKPFLQSWFSIGLWEAALGKALEKDRFIKWEDSKAMFTSETLQPIVRELVDHFSNTTEEEAGKVEILERMKHVLKAASLWNRMLSETRLFVDINPEFCDETFHGMMRMFTLLGVTLQYTGELLAIWVPGSFRAQLQNPWRFTSHLQERLRERMLERGWCPYILTMLSPFNVIVQEYAAINGPPATHFRHDACSSVACIRHNIDESSYQPLHTRPDCQCTWVRPSVSKIREILDNGQIPLMDLNKVCETGDGRVVDVVPFEPDNTAFCAVSHVWSGGLGSVSEEGLPQCTLDMLSGYIEDSGYPSKLVWIDSLCIPRDRRLRNLSIHTINRVYSQANRTLVLDPELVRTGSSSTRRVLLWITTAAWMQRMWTLPEGRLSRLPLMAFKDGTVLLQQCFDDASSDLHNPITGALEPDLWALFSEDINQLRYIHQSLSYRTTSKRDDEVLALAALFDIDIGPILGKKSLDERMALFWIAVKEKVTIPINILFLNTPRLPIPGLRWAPSSLLNAGRQLSLLLAPKGTDAYNVQLSDNGTLTGTYVVIRLNQRATIWLNKFNPIWLTFLPDAGSRELRRALFTIEAGGEREAKALHDIDAFAVNVTNIEAKTGEALVNELVASVRSVIALTLDTPDSHTSSQGTGGAATTSSQTDTQRSAHLQTHSFRARRRLQLSPIETSGNELISGIVGWARISIS